MKSALLVLENGLSFEGYAFGDLSAEACGEVVFNTAMTGYQEVLTDPSYKGQIITFSYPHIGNYGINTYDGESSHAQAEGIIVREFSRIKSNWRSGLTLEDYMQEHRLIGIEGLDTRALIKVLRTEGAMRGIISAKELNKEVLRQRVKTLPEMEGLDLVREVSTKNSYIWKQQPEPFLLGTSEQHIPSKFRVAALDFGIKYNILRRLALYGCEVTVFPATTNADEILKSNPDGVFLSNGPGDPAALDYAISTIRALLPEKPIFGICLGHQLLALACGAKTYKMKFGHRGVNHPIKNLLTGKIEITSQNHGFAVDIASLPAQIELTHINLNDNTCAGFRHKEYPVFCVQYHPEASPGTHDSDYLFSQFISAMSARKPSPVRA